MVVNRAKTNSVLLIMGNQLFPEDQLPDPTSVQVFMAEDQELCTYYRFHKHKILLFLAAMRSFADRLRLAGYDVTYMKLDLGDKRTYEEKLGDFIADAKANELICFEIEDKFMEKRIYSLAVQKKVPLRWLQSPMFLTSRQQFASYLKKTKKPFMKTFYEWKRRELKLLLNHDGSPVGGKFSFDDENRKSLPAGLKIPKLPKVEANKHVKDVGELANNFFSGHPGDVSDFWLPVCYEGASIWLDEFLAKRFANFGLYEDAITGRDLALFHSVLSPMMNLGLLTPAEVIKRTISFCENKKIPLNSLEGFLRQVIGWREFVRGIYQNFSERQDADNFFHHKRKLKKSWYAGTTGLPPLDDAIKKTIKFGWAHHIERLMIISCTMLLSEVDPREVHRWFMEMYVDSSDWVMGPNVYGMGQFSDGGIFATKPYICGSNYILKMSDYKKGPWCDEWDGLYWKFVDEKFKYLGKNPRLSMMVAMWNKKSHEQKNNLHNAAQKFIDRNTTEADG